MKTISIIIILVQSFIAVGLCQTDEELRNSWNSEVEQVGNSMVEAIKSEINGMTEEKKRLNSKNYINCTLSIYRKGNSIKKMNRVYFIGELEYIEDYYFSGNWPIYVEIKNSENSFADKYYFDKAY